MFFVLTVLSNKEFNTCMHEFFCESEELPRSATTGQRRLHTSILAPSSIGDPQKYATSPLRRWLWNRSKHFEKETQII